MKIVIDIPDDAIERLENGSFGTKYNCYDTSTWLMNGAPLPENATNGEMFVAVFKPYKVIEWSAQVQVYLTDEKWQMFGIRWWNAPYKKEG